MPSYLDSALNELDSRLREPKREGMSSSCSRRSVPVTAAHVANQPWARRWRELRAERGDHVWSLRGQPFRCAQNGVSRPAAIIGHAANQRSSTTGKPPLHGMDHRIDQLFRCVRSSAQIPAFRSAACSPFLAGSERDSELLQAMSSALCDRAGVTFTSCPRRCIGLTSKGSLIHNWGIAGPTAPAKRWDFDGLLWSCPSVARGGAAMRGLLDKGGR